MKKLQIFVVIIMLLVTIALGLFVFKTCSIIKEHNNALKGTVMYVNNDSVQSDSSAYFYKNVNDVLNYRNSLAKKSTIDSVFLSMSIPDLLDISEYVLNKNAYATEIDIVDEYLKRHDIIDDILAHTPGPTPQEQKPNNVPPDSNKHDTIMFNNKPYVAL